MRELALRVPLCSTGDGRTGERRNFTLRASFCAPGSLRLRHHFMGSELGCPKRVAGKEKSERIGRLRSLGKASLPSIPFPPLSCYPSPAPAPRPVPRLGRKFAVLPLSSHFPSRAKNGRILLLPSYTIRVLPELHATA